MCIRSDFHLIWHVSVVMKTTWHLCWQLSCAKCWAHCDPCKMTFASSRMMLKIKAHKKRFSSELVAMILSLHWSIVTFCALLQGNSSLNPFKQEHKSAVCWSRCQNCSQQLSRSQWQSQRADPGPSLFAHENEHSKTCNYWDKKVASPRQAQWDIDWVPLRSEFQAEGALRHWISPESCCFADCGVLQQSQWSSKIDQLASQHSQEEGI